MENSLQRPLLKKKFTFPIFVSTLYCVCFIFYSYRLIFLFLKTLAKDHILLLGDDHRLYEYTMTKTEDDYKVASVAPVITDVLTVCTGANHAIIRKSFTLPFYYQ